MQIPLELLVEKWMTRIIRLVRRKAKPIQKGEDLVEM